MLVVKPAIRRKINFDPVLEDSLKNVSANVNVPAVNIWEDDQNFALNFAAPGLNKSDFNIKVEKGILTVSVVKEVKEDENKKEIRREFGNYNFERSFRLGDQVDTDKIVASYEAGILKVLVPKKEKATPLTIQVK